VTAASQAPQQLRRPPRLDPTIRASPHPTLESKRAIFPRHSLPPSFWGIPPSRRPAQPLHPRRTHG
jgi:hypothetical protein